MPKFSRVDSQNFFKTLNKRVNAYFKDNNIKKTGNWQIHLKTVIMISMMVIPYVYLMFFDSSTLGQLGCVVFMGVGMAGIGMNVMHDGNHGSYSSKDWVNKLMGSTIYFLAGSVFNWKVKHNMLHHTYTNMPGYDEDLEAGLVIRFTHESKWYSFHKFQHLYSVVLYGLLTLNWSITTDFIQLKRYLKRGLTYKNVLSPTREWFRLVIAKINYWFIWIVAPIFIFDLVWYKVVIGFCVMHYVSGLILSLVFQLAHIVEDTTNPLPDLDLKIENTWAIHQLYTTANFAPNNWFVNWYTGGLNHQIEHHIYPHISHVHYGKIAAFIKQTAAECNLPYYEFKTTREAIKAHFEHLKDLGKKPQLSI